MSFSTKFSRRMVSGAVTFAMATTASLALAAPSQADDLAARTLPSTTVSADALPTVQINGVVWSQVVVGNRVYVTGSFTSARPAGSPAGTNETARSNLLAYDITTGNLISSWAPTLNSTGLGITASPDGSRIYVVGNFTSVNGIKRYRVVALDATTGAVITSFNAGADYRVRGIVATNDTVYLGGAFSSVGGQARSRLAAVSAATGAVLPWAPAADAEVMAMVRPAATPNQIVVAGRFSTLNGDSSLGSGALDATTGATQPWAVQAQANDYGPNAAIYSLSTDGSTVYGTGYNFYGTGNLENTFAATADGGNLKWVNGCYGDTYSSFPSAGVVYTAGHAHNCSAVGGHPQTQPWTFQHALAFTADATTTNNGGNFNGMPGAKVVQWLPELAVGTFTGQSQAAWNVTGDSRYVVMGGEFPKVNGTAQQGLVRFAVKDLAPKKSGPIGKLSSELKPTLVALPTGAVRAGVTAAWDRDDATLKYELLRGTNASTAAVVATTVQASTWWNRPTTTLFDKSAPAGSSQTYRVRVTDGNGNVLVGNPTTVTVSAAGANSAYSSAVTADGAEHFWRLDESTGATGLDSVGGDDLTLDASATRGAAGATGDGDTATTFAGTAEVPAGTTNATTGPQVFSTEAWFNTTSTSGGKIIGFGDSATGTSGGYDRHVYMTNDGKLVGGVYVNGIQTVTSKRSYNDGQWHQVVMTQGDNGLALFVDGVQVGRKSDVRGAQPFSGYWRIGGDNLDWWPNQPAARAFAGSIDDVSVYPNELTATQVANHFTASGRTPGAGVPAPTDAYGAAVFASKPQSFWRLQETSGTSVKDSGPEGGNDATVFGGVTLGTAGAPGISGSTGATFDGQSGSGIGANDGQQGTNTYSMELWFSTTTDRGGKLVGFGGSQNWYSGAYDRHVFMQRDGSLRFGAWTGQENLVTTSGSFNDGKWHHLVATQGADGMALYVDGVLQGTNPQTQAQDYYGFWRVGGDSSWGDSENGYFAGSIDDVAIYDRALSADEVTAHQQAGNR
ncbi:LamG-like jellyroll fold domain-containing protein [Kineococcus gynurae]|uniref:LamG-like jellyroll fold domain-containing protein n=1 Tax=Kineococcus gynurae TaxID=452979 RepID=A0ABV5LWH0_9ACTN